MTGLISALEGAAVSAAAGAAAQAPAAAAAPAVDVRPQAAPVVVESAAVDPALAQQVSRVTHTPIILLRILTVIEGSANCRSPGYRKGDRSS